MFFIINDYGNGGMHRCDGSGLIGSILPKISRRHHRAEYRMQRFFTNFVRPRMGMLRNARSDHVSANPRSRRRAETSIR
jgi:hypothetical protein